MVPGINLHYCRHFAKHYLRATRVDVLHSPFVFDLYQTCIKRQKNHAAYSNIEALRERLKQDQTPLSQLDLGTDNPVIRKRTIKELAYIHSKPARIVQILYRIIDRYKYNNVLELGTSLGISSAYHALAIKRHHLPSDARFTTVEGAPDLYEAAKSNFRELSLSEYIIAQQGNFDELLPDILTTYSTIDYAFIDGNHRYGPTMRYFNQLLTKIHNNSMIVLDDIYWSAGMKKAWEEIKEHPQVTVTVDLFFIGLVFFRKEQAKEHFRLRIL